MANADLKKYRDALAVAKQEFAKRSFSKMVELSGGEQDGENSLNIHYRGRVYRVQYPEGNIRPCDTEDGEDPLDITDHIVILQYLTEVCGLQASGKWISFRELPGGEYHYGALKQEAMNPLAERFGNAPEEFERVCQRLGGRRIPMGDMAFAISLLPKVEVAFVLWLADEEFPAQANILFDANASTHLNTEGLEVLAINAVEEMVKLG